MKVALQMNHWAFYEFKQAKFAYGGLVLDSSQFSILPLVKIDSK